MRALKILLFSIYTLLIVLLLVANMKRCRSSQSEHTSSRIDEPVDTTDVVREAEQIGQKGALKVTLLWDFDGDIDLHAKQPNGVEIFFDKKHDRSTGGTLDVDNQRGGNGSAENIYWAEPPKGDYTIYLDYYAKSSSTGKIGSGICTVVVFQEGYAPQSYKVKMSRVKERKTITTIKIKHR